MKLLHPVDLFESYDDARTCESRTLHEVEINCTKDVETVKKKMLKFQCVHYEYYLTLRLLMSYIYIYIYIYIYMKHLFLMFLDHTQRRSTVGRTPLDE